MTEAPKIYVPKGDHFVDALTAGPIKPGTAVYDEGGNRLGYYSRTKNGGIVYLTLKSQAIKYAEAVKYESTDWVNANEAPAPGTRSVHNKGEAIMEPEWAKPTLDERLTVNTDPEKSAHDPISNPAHYGEGRKHKPKDVIRDWGLNFNLGSAVKYLSRAGRKDAIINDLEKAKTFIQFEIEALAEEGEEEE